MNICEFIGSALDNQRLHLIVEKFLDLLGSGFAILAGGALLFFAGPLAAQPNDNSWAAHNRTITASLGALRQDYTENDPSGLTTDGTLDTERGTLNSVELGARWQFESLPLLLQATAHRSSGGTRYSGYLQSGNLLTPYSASTGNVMLDYAVRAGLPVAKTENFQWVPFIEYRYQNWTRELVQYRETSQHHAAVVGLLGQWRASPLWTLEGEASAGKLLHAQTDVPKLGFSGDRGNQTLWSLGASAGYRIKNHWRAVATIRYEQCQYSQSTISNGFIEPASHTRQTNTLFGIEYQL